MAYDRNQAAPFWDFIRSFEAQNLGQTQGEGVDHPARAFGASYPEGAPPPFYGAGFPFGGNQPGHFGGPGPFGGPPHRGWGGPFGHFRGGHGGGGRGGCRRGRHCGRRSDGEEEREGSRHGSRSPSPHDEPREGEESATEDPQVPQGPHGPHRHGRRHGSRGPHAHHHGPHHHGGPRHERRRGGPPPFGGPGGPGGLPFDLSAILGAVASHPLAQAFKTYAEQAGLGADGQRQQSSETLVAEDNENSFTPPIDVFSTPSAYVLHVALPGAKKEDVGVNWDAEKNELNVAGVVYRQGDEDFLKSLSNGERKVGVFERNIKLPPGQEEKEEVDGDAITAKLEDGVLVVTVPKVEKEWTEVKKVDIN